MGIVTKPRTSYAFTIWGRPHQVIRGFKHLDDGMQCRGRQFQEGQTYTHEGELRLCNAGFHFCRHLERVAWYKDLFQGSTHFVECRGVIGDPRDKEACREITIGRTLTFQEVCRLANDGQHNFGFGNRGNFNRGNFNRGNSNRGNSNRGNSNRGDSNRGNSNRGDSNRGNSNRGNFNRGDSNRGNFNRGDSNRGNFNRGNFNRGNSNRGDNNRGDSNWGDKTNILTIKLNQD